MNTTRSDETTKPVHLDGSQLALLKKLARAALLIIDDLGITGTSPKQYRRAGAVDS